MSAVLKAVPNSPVVEPQAKPLTELTATLLLATEAEKHAKQARIEAEEAICTHPDVINQLKEEGTTSVDGLVSINTGYTRKWDQAKLKAIQENIKAEYWPFDSAGLKEVRSDSKMIEKNFPDLWLQIATALSLTPKKMAVKVIPAKD